MITLGIFSGLLSGVTRTLAGRLPATLGGATFAAGIRAKAKARAGQYLTLRLGEDECAIDILQVQEIRSLTQTFEFEQTSGFVKGVVQHRGAQLPIADLRLKTKLQKADYNKFTVVIVLNLRGKMVGAVVDAVSDIVTLTADSIRPVPQTGVGLDGKYIFGLAKVAERKLVVLNVDALVSKAELALAR